MFLLVQNSGIAPIEGFTVLGVSTSRGNSSKIGMFGSGLKNAINILLRYGLNPVIYLGDKELKFFSKPEFMGDKQFSRVYYSYNGTIEKTGFSLEFGAIDWTSVEMALREIVSNAIDADGHENMIMDIVQEPVAYENATSIYIPLNPDVQRYYNDISNMFLHFTNKHDQKALVKSDKTQARIYRKGVFVRSIDNKKNPSLFDYNLDDNSSIDECRNMSDYTCLVYCSKILTSNKDLLKKYFSTLVDNNSVWEDDFSYYHYDDYELAKEAWNEVYGSKLACDSDFIATLAREKGKEVVMVRNFEALKGLGIPTAYECLLEIEQDGCQVIPPTNDLIKNLNKVWRKLEGVGLTNGKEKPQAKSFKQVNNGSIKFGFYKNNCIYVNVDHSSSMQTILEECAHYITGATDGSRIFQEFAFNVACRLVPQWNK